MRAGIRVNYVYLDPISPSQVPNGALFLDSSNANAPTIKSTGGITDPIDAGSASNIFIKQMQIDGPIAINRHVSKKSNGRIIQADSDNPDGQQVVGVALQAGATAGDLINVLCVGANLAGALTGLGFAPGEEIYLSEASGFTNNPNSFTGGDDTIMKVGVADCAAGVASGTAVDLISFPEIIARP